jgi:competence protein ComEC
VALVAFEGLGSTVADAGKGRARGWPWLTDRLAGVWAAVVEDVRAQHSQMLLFAPLFMLVGNWLYFQLTGEPPLAMGLACLAAALLLMLQQRRSPALFAVGLLVLGFSTAKFRADLVATPMLRGPVNGVEAAGYVADLITRSNGAKNVIVALSQASAVPADEMPRRVRLYATSPGDIQIGDYITFKAYLAPLPRPVDPGGFDFGRMLYFQSIGAGGRILGEPVVEPRPIPLNLEYRRVFRAIRAAISNRITTAIPGPVGRLADSMVSGERSGIPTEINTSLQISGLAHIISISGLHMSMVAGGVFWAVRALLALLPGIALRFPIKKIAATAGLAVGGFYTLLADSGSATERSFLMIAVMFFAILVDRPALSLRNLAIAAILILLLTPEESVGASFQMSFLAVLGITTFHHWWRAREMARQKTSETIDRAWPARLKRLVIVSSLTTLAASGSSTIAAVYHFDRLSPYSVLANGITMPVSEALVMPPAIIAVLLMPFGLEYWPLKVMEFGLLTTMKVSDWVASLPAADFLVPRPSVVGIALIACGAIVIAAGIGRFRLTGLALALIGLMIAPLSQRPQILVEDRAAAVAVMDAAGAYVFSSGTKNKFASAKWLQANGESTGLIEAEARTGWDCTSGDCFTDLGPMSISYLREKSGQGAYCPPTPIIIADFPLHHACKEARIVIDRIDVWRKGAHAVTFANDRFSVTTARDRQGNRPWTYDSRKGIGTKARPGEAPEAQAAQ